MLYSGDAAPEKANSDHENPDLEDGEIEDDDDDEPIVESPMPVSVAVTVPAPAPAPILASSSVSAPAPLPAPIPTDTHMFTDRPIDNHSHTHSHSHSHLTTSTPAKDKKKHTNTNTNANERKPDKHGHLTEAEKCVRMLHKIERAERERRERLRREQMQDDWAGNVEKAIASVLKKDSSNLSADEQEEPVLNSAHASTAATDDKKRGRKRKKKERERKKKHRKTESPPKHEEVDEDEMLNVRGASPDGKLPENSPFAEGEQQQYDSYDSEYDSEPYHNNRPNKRNFERERKGRNRNRESRRDRKNFREKNRNKKENEQNRAQIQDAGSICMFYMQGKCHKGEECPYSHDALPPLKLELCKFYLMECCAKRDKCLYMHSEFPCKYYHTGLKCHHNDNCKFAHGKPLSDTLRQVLLKHLETAPKEILGDFPRLSREGAQHMVALTQKTLEIQYGIKNGTNSGANTDKTSIPSLFDITVPVPHEFMQQNQTPQQNVTNTEEVKVKPEKPTKVRVSRWNDEPAVPVAPVPAQPFYSEHDQDMRVNSNGDVDMRALPPVASVLKLEEAAMDTDIRQQVHPDQHTLPLNHHQQDLSVDFTQDIHIHNMDSHSILTIDEKAVTAPVTAPVTVTATTDADMTGNDSGSELPSNLPKKQRELFLRIAAQQKENIPENQNSGDETSALKDDDWYSSDDDNDPLSKMVIHLEDEPTPNPEPPRIFSPPVIKPVEVIDKLGDLSKIDISAEVTKLLTSIKSGQNANLNNVTNTVTVANAAISPAAVPSLASTSVVAKCRDPRQANTLDIGIKSPSHSGDPRRPPTHNMPPTNNTNRLSIYELGALVQDTTPIHTAVSARSDTDLRALDTLPQDLDMRRPHYGDTDLRQHSGAGIQVATNDATSDATTAAATHGRQDVDLRQQLGLPFKAMLHYTPATEIQASIQSYTPKPYKVHVVDIPRPDYSGLKLHAQDAQVSADPRLRKIFRVPSIDERDSPASPKQQQPQQQSPPKPARQDPRRRNETESSGHTNTKHTLTPDISTLNYSQQLQLLQNSAFYQSLTSNQKLMLNNEIASKGDQNAPNDPILAGILANLGLVPMPMPIPGTNANTHTHTLTGNILANVNSMVPQMGTGMMGMAMNPHMEPPNMNFHPSMAPGLLGPAPAMGITPNEFQINFDPRNGGLLGQAPYQNQNYQDNQNYQYNEEFYPENDFNGANNGGNNSNYNNSRPERNFRERNSNNNNRRGRSWNNRHNNRNYNRNNRNRSNRSYTPP